MGNTTKTKAAMLNELESIKGLLLEEDDIPILQEEVAEHPAKLTPIIKQTIQQQSEAPMAAQNSALPTKTVFEEQQDFFHALNHSNAEDHHATAAAMALVESELLETLTELEKHTSDITPEKLNRDSNKNSFTRPNLAKATGENPFLPQHIRSRLHGNNPPPLFANETARKIANSSAPSRQLGNTFMAASSEKSHQQQDIIDSIIEKMMPEIEKELRSRLETLSKNLLEELKK